MNSSERPSIQADWRKATYSTGNGACVEVRVDAGRARVRDSQDPGGPAMSVSQPIWRRFISQVQNDYFP
jgi:hypothetical protein